MKQVMTTASAIEEARARREAAMKKNAVHEYERLMIEDGLKHIPNRFEMILIAGQRARQLHDGHRAHVDIGSRENVTALREIAGGFVGRELLRLVRDNTREPGQ
jgi:DNA-directed RNA polymerase subunit omega